MGKNINKNMAKILIWNGPNWPMRLKIESTSNAMLFSSLFLTAPGMTVGKYFTSSAPLWNILVLDYVRLCLFF